MKIALSVHRGLGKFVSFSHKEMICQTEHKYFHRKFHKYFMKLKDQNQSPIQGPQSGCRAMNEYS